MILEEIVVTAFQQIARVVGCEKTRRAICVDPGDDAERIGAALERHDLALQTIALTHAHMDHVGGVAALKRERPKAEIILHAADEPLYYGLPAQPAWLGIPRARWGALGFEYEEPPRIDRHWQDGEVYEVGSLAFKVLHCPGHTPGHVVFVSAALRVAIVGDVLFRGSIGRTDFPYGDHAALLAAIHGKLLPLGDDIGFLCGHGPGSTFGHERQRNPFLRGE